MAWLAFVVIVSIVATFTAVRNRNSKPRVVERALGQVWKRLTAEHGVREFYSGSQVAAALTSVGVTDEIAPFAYARYCREAEFREAPGCGGLGYRQLRDELLQASRGARGVLRPPGV